MSILRRLLIAEIVLVCISIPLILFSGAITEAMMQESGLSQEASDAEMVVLAFSCMFFVVLIPALIVAWVGLFNFRSWARWLYLGVTVAGYLLSIPISLFDFSMTWQFPNVVAELSAPISGAVIAIVFLTPIARRFGQTAAPTDI